MQEQCIAFSKIYGCVGPTFNEGLWKYFGFLVQTLVVLLKKLITCFVHLKRTTLQEEWRFGFWQELSINYCMKGSKKINVWLVNLIKDVAIENWDQYFLWGGVCLKNVGSRLDISLNNKKHYSGISVCFMKPMPPSLDDISMLPHIHTHICILDFEDNQCNLVILISKHMNNWECASHMTACYMVGVKSKNGIIIIISNKEKACQVFVVDVMRHNCIDFAMISSLAVRKRG